MAIDLRQAPFELNLAETLDEADLERIGQELLGQIEIDEQSRSEWMETNKDWLRLAAQVREDKTFPWPGASNVKYPLLTIASMQFHARALPNLINSNKPIRVRTLGRDPDGEKTKRANRTSTYMSYQVLEDIPDWLDEMDRLLFILPMTGIAYKKTFFSENEGRIKSQVILPNDLIVNYHAQNFDRARMTQVLYMDENEVYELQKSGVFLDIDLEPQAYDVNRMNRNAFEDINQIHETEGSNMESLKLYESHCYVDLDDDGYKEPYVVTLTAEGKILRIAARWDAEKGVFYNADNEVRKIVPDHYFTAYIFLPDPSSAVSGLGLGSLLGPLNEAVNTIINQLTDAGTLSNLQSGFLGRGIKLRGGAMRFRPGEWKIVNTTGDDIKKSIFPMPIKEPSSTLFSLLGLLIESGERVSSVSDMMVGENPGQNQPATTTMAVLEQGLQMFTTINKRIHRQLGKEYQKLYKLNSIYLDEELYNLVLDEEQRYGSEDFDWDDIDIRPASDPAIVSQAQKSVKAQALIEKLAMGLPLNIQIVTQRALEAEGHEDIEQLMQVPERQPDPEVILKMQEFQHKVQMDQLQKQLDTIKIRSQAVKDQTGAELNKAKIEEMGAGAALKLREQELKEIETEAQMIKDRVEASIKANQVAQQGERRNEGKQKAV